MRKKNTSVIFATQSLTDVDKSEISSSLYESCPTKLLLTNPYAATTGKSLYEKIGLNETEIQQITNAPNYSYYYTSPNGRRLFHLRLGPVQMAFVSGTSADGTRQVRKLAEKHGEVWPHFFLKEKGLEKAANDWVNAVQEQL